MSNSENKSTCAETGTSNSDKKKKAKGTCATTGCNRPATLVCPICKKNNILIRFCGQECFKGFYKRHKVCHKLIKSKPEVTEAIKNLKGTKEEFFSGCASGFMTAIENSLNHGIDIDVRGKNGMTGLMFAAIEDQTDVIKFLFEHGADPSIATKKGARAIHLAACMGRLAAIRAMHARLGSGILEQTTLENQTPLIEACINGHEHVVRWLVDNGAKLNSKDKEGKTAMDYAKENDYSDIVDVLDMEEEKRKMEAEEEEDKVE